MNLVARMRGGHSVSGVDTAALIDLVAYATIAFLYERETDRSIERVLTRLGQGLTVDRVFLKPLAPEFKGQVWSMVSPVDDLALVASTFPEDGRWMKQLAQGNVVTVQRVKAGDEDLRLLDRLGVASAILAPVFVNGKWWGVLGALHEQLDRRWSRLHGKVMLAIAGTLSAALQSDVETDRLKESHANLLVAQRSADTYRRRMDELVRASQDAILIIEPDGLVSRWNDPANELFGFGARHRPNRGYLDFLPVPIRTTVAAMVEDARRGQASLAKSVDLSLGTSLRNLLLSVFPLGEPMGTVALVAHDQTEVVSNRERLQTSLAATVEALASAMEARDPYTAGHQRRTAEFARRIALAMGLSQDEVAGVHTAAVIHDIGKIRVPSEILTCPRSLSDAEFALIREHSIAGHEIIKTVNFPWPVAMMVLQHHERMDGSGYPYGLAGSQISVGARIIGVADTVEAITNHRPYRPALGIGVARGELVKGRFNAYDPTVVDACLMVLDEGGFD